MKKGQNYYKTMAADAILDHMDISELVDIYNRMAEQNDYPIRVFDNTAMILDEEVMPMRGAWAVLDAAMKGCWLQSDSFVYLNETQRGTELHSFSRILDKDCPIYLSELLEWLEGEDFAPLAEICYNDYCKYGYILENCFRMFAEEDEGFSPVGIGIFIGQHDGITLDDNWDNYIIDMHER